MKLMSRRTAIQSVVFSFRIFENNLKSNTDQKDNTAIAANSDTVAEARRQTQLEESQR